MRKNKLIIFTIISIVLAFPILALAEDVGPKLPAAQQKIIDAVISVTKFAMNALLAVGALFLVLSGFMFILARGEEAKLASARSMLLWSILGIAIGALAPVFWDIAVSVTGKWW